MRVHSTSPLRIVSFALLAAGLTLSGGPHAWTQSPPPATPANGGLFPDPAEPVLKEKATLRGLLESIQRKDADTAGAMIWQLLAEMYKARELGNGPSEFLAAGYRAEKLKGTDAATVQNCLLSAWAGAQTLALFTPENVALMERGSAPQGTRGFDRGKPALLDLENLPAVVVTTKPKAAKVAQQEPLPAATPAPVASTIAVKTLEVRLQDRVSLDEYGLHNLDFRLDSVDPHGYVTFLIADRSGNHFGHVIYQDSTLRLNREMAFSDGVSRMVRFTPDLIPDTKIHGVKLFTLPFGAVYLDEDIGVQVSFRLVIRVSSEALMYNQLPPERQKLYEINAPPP